MDIVDDAILYQECLKRAPKSLQMLFSKPKINAIKAFVGCFALRIQLFILD